MLLVRIHVWWHLFTVHILTKLHALYMRIDVREKSKEEEEIKIIDAADEWSGSPRVPVAWPWLARALRPA